MKRTKTIKRIAALMLAMLTTVSTFLHPPAAKADGETTKVHTRTTGWLNGECAALWNGGHIRGDRNWYLVYSDTTGEPIYCVEPGVDISGGDVLNVNDWLDSLITPSITEKQQASTLLGRLFQYVDYSSTGRPQDTNDGKALYIAVRVLVWEVTQGERDAQFNYVAPPSGYDPVLQSVTGSGNMPGNIKTKVLDFYNSLSASVIAHHTIPSFAEWSAYSAPTYTLVPVGGVLTATLPADTNGVLANYNFAATGMTFSQSGNTLTATATSAYTGGPVTVTATSKSTQRSGVVCYGDGSGGVQDIVQAGSPIDDPIRAYFKLEGEPQGFAHLTKTAEDGAVSGLQFRFVGPDGYDKTFTTNASGEISAATIGDLAPGTYTVTEVGTPGKYVQPASQTVTIVAGETAEVNFSNILKKFRVTVTKTDTETTTAQGNASLQGAQYGVYKDGALLDTYTTGADGKFTTKYYPCGTGYTVREVAPSAGYTLDPTAYPVPGTDAATYTVELNSVALAVKETVAKGKIGIFKHHDDGSTHIDTPEVGAQFEVYLSSAGSYAAAKVTERDTITTDSDGYAETQMLPYGKYIVTQTVAGGVGLDLMPAFEVTIAENGKTYRYIINNDSFSARLRVVKRDSETGETIPRAGAEFEIYDPNGKQVTQTVFYPNVSVISTFTTNAAGEFTTPLTLPAGTGYKLVEVTAPEGYLLAADPVEFDILPATSAFDGTTNVVTVDFSDAPQMGKISITKTGEAFAGMTELLTKDGTPTLLWSKNKLADAVFGVYAKSDIVTPDGTVRLAAGGLADTITTDADGVAETIPLYLGTYEVRELTAPEGYVLATSAYEVTLTYAGQDVALAATAVAIEDARQKVEVSLTKTMLADERGLIAGKLARVSFGLYAAETIPAVTTYTQSGDSIVVLPAIPAGTFLAVVSVSEDGTAAFVVELPFGRYYVHELATDDGYALDPTQYPVEFAYAGQDVATVKIALNDGKAIENKPVLGDIVLVKVNAEDTESTLSGAEFTVFTARKGASGNLEFVEVAKLNEDTEKPGTYAARGLPVGAYYVQETKAPAGFLRDTEYYLVTITEAKEYVVANDKTGLLFEDVPGTPPPNTAETNLLPAGLLLAAGLLGCVWAAVVPAWQRRRKGGTNK
ncbi:MAG: hypothetical protein LBO63_07925 [Oscillospiraceae bacterium]|nr:hypothetical protein [Oscillospiraceae bacterium]